MLTLRSCLHEYSKKKSDYYVRVTGQSVAYNVTVVEVEPIQRTVLQLTAEDSEASL